MLEIIHKQPIMIKAGKKLITYSNVLFNDESSPAVTSAVDVIVTISTGAKNSFVDVST